MQRFQSEMQHDLAQRLRLVEGTQRRKLRVGQRRGAFAAAAQIIDAEHPETLGVDAEPRSDDLRPPACRAVDDAMRRYAAEHGHHRRIFRARQAKSDARVGQLIAMVQPPGTRQLEHRVI